MYPSIIYIGGYPPVLARLSEYNYEIIKALSENRLVKKYKIKIDVISIKPDIITDIQESGPISNVNVKYLWYNLTSLFIPLRLIRLRTTHQYIVFSLYHGIFGNSGFTNIITLFLLMLTSKLLKYKIIVILHTLPELRTDLLHRMHKRFYYIYKIGYYIFTIMCLTFSSKTVLLVEAYHQHLIRYLEKHKKKIIYIPHGVPIYYKFKPKSISNKNKIIIGFIGLISPRKELSFLIKTVKELIASKKTKEYELVLIGAPHPYMLKKSYTKIRKIFQDNSEIKIKYIGYLNTEKLQKYVSLIDFVILPYTAPTGTSGIANLIAPSGTPIIMPSFLEYQELYNKGHGIKLYPPKENNYKNIAELISYLLTHSTEYKRLSSRAILFSNTYRIEKSAMKLLNIILS